MVGTVRFEARIRKLVKNLPDLAALVEPPQEEYMLAKRWREHGDRDAADKLVTDKNRLQGCSRYRCTFRTGLL
jgi:hypothetical protein